MTSARSTAAQCGAMVAAALLTLRPLLVGYELDLAARALTWVAALAVLATAVLCWRAASPDASPDDPAKALFAGRPMRRLSLAARGLAAAGVLISLLARLHEAGVTATPALFWFSALAAIALAAWACVHLRASLVRARFFWVLCLGMVLAVLSALERPDTVPPVLTGPQRLEPGAGVNLVLGVGTLLLGEGHPGAELFALVPLYAPASSAVEPRVPWFRHLASLAAALLVGLLVFALRSSKLGMRGVSRASSVLAMLSLVMLLLPMLISPEYPAAFDGVVLWLLGGAAALFAPAREELAAESAHA